MTAAPQAAGRAHPAAPWHLLLLAAFLAGTALRLWQLDIQVLIDDEWHAIHKLLAAGPADIVTHFGFADYSIPLTLYYQALYRTIGLSEWGMHVPPLAAGIALMIAGPRLLARWSPPPVRAVWLALVALSPLLVYHSKVARPYALTSLLTFVAIVAFRAWWCSGRRRDGVIYATATFFAGWLHAVTLPFTLLPFGYYGMQSLARAMRRTPERSAPAGSQVPPTTAPLRRLALLGAATALSLVVVLAPPFFVDWRTFAARAGNDSVTAEALQQALLMLAGTGSPLVGALVWGCAALGFARLARREHDVARYLATIVVGGAVVLVSVGAAWIFHPLVLARYLLPALPFVLLFAAEGIAAIVEHAGPAPMQAAAAAAIAVALLAAGPIPGEWHYPNQFWGHLRYQFTYDPLRNPYVQLVREDAMPAFYRQLAKLPPGSVTLIEMPWLIESHYNPQSHYQDVHRQIIRIGLTTPTCGVRDYADYPEERRGMKMRELVHLSSILRGDATGADYLVIHAKPKRGETAADPGAEWPDISSCLPLVEKRLGAPIYRDDQVVVYRLSRVAPLVNGHRPVQQ